MSLWTIRKHEKICSPTEVVTGKQLKEFVKQFDDKELVTALFINEKIVREEHTDGLFINEYNYGFEKTKKTKSQIKQILQKIHTWDLNKELGWRQINMLNEKF